MANSSHGDEIPCLRCHAANPDTEGDIHVSLFRENLSTICVQCHDAHKGEGSHPVEVKPTMEIPGDMPLDGRGCLTCITCHTFHNQWKPLAENTNKLLRRENGFAFCFSCHNKR